jgi:hypothetical protein
MAASINQSSHPGLCWWMTLTHIRARNMAMVIGPKIHAITVSVFGLFSGLMKFGRGQVITASKGTCIPPGIVAVCCVLMSCELTRREKEDVCSA